MESSNIQRSPCTWLSKFTRMAPSSTPVGKSFFFVTLKITYVTLHLLRLISFKWLQTRPNRKW
jgi:hypothetical protein